MLRDRVMTVVEAVTVVLMSGCHPAFLTGSLNRLECLYLFRCQDLFHFIAVFLNHLFHRISVPVPHLFHLSPVFSDSFLPFRFLAFEQFSEFCSLLFREIQFS